MTDVEKKEYEALLENFFYLTQAADALDAVALREEANKVRDVRQSFEPRLKELKGLYHCGA